MGNFILIKQGSYYDVGDFSVFCIKDASEVANLPTEVAPLSEAYFVDSSKNELRKWMLDYDKNWVEIIEAAPAPAPTPDPNPNP